MRNIRSALLAAAALLLAGCTATSPPNAASAADAYVITDPSDYGEYAMHPEGATYLHDYWQNKFTILLLEKSMVWRGASVTSRTAAGPLFLPPDDRLVPPGTKWVNVTVDTKNLRTSPGKIHLDIQTAGADTRLALPADGKLSFESRPELNDREHQILSAWSFRLVFEPDPSGPYQAVGDVSLRVELARGIDLTPRPNPLRATPNESLLVLNAQGAAGPLAAGTCITNCPPILRAEQPVPLGTKRVTVKLAYTVQGSTTTTEPGLAYHPAHTRAWIALVPKSQQAGVREYEIDVDSYRMSDSPFADRSSWEFRLFNEKPQGANMADGFDYRLMVTAHPATTTA